MVENINLVKEIFFNKKVFLTGHTGFKGSWFLLILKELGCNVKGFSLDPFSEKDLYNLIEGDKICNSIIGDINDQELLKTEILGFQPDFIFHFAAQPLVIKSYEEPVDTYKTNVIGTANLLNSLKSLNKKCSTVIITTDKVYFNIEKDYPYKETDRLGGNDPYSSSKACVELLTSSFRNSFFNVKDIDFHKKAIAVARAGNVIGGGDWSENRIIPDIANSINNNHAIKIRNPFSTRPWQHVLDPLFGYLQLASRLYKDPELFSTEYNFGPSPNDTITVKELVEYSINYWGKGSYVIENKFKYPESSLLKLDINKAAKDLNWKPLFGSKKSIDITLEWYKIHNQNKNKSVKLIVNLIRKILKNDQSK